MNHAIQQIPLFIQSGVALVAKSFMAVLSGPVQTIGGEEVGLNKLCLSRGWNRV